MHKSAADALQDKLIAAMSAERKLEVSDGLRRAAWSLKGAWLSERNPGLTPEQVHAEVRRLFADAGC